MQKWTLFRADDTNGLNMEGRQSDLLADIWLEKMPAPGDRVTDHAPITPSQTESYGDWFVKEVHRSADWIIVCWCEYIEKDLQLTGIPA
jgi:hypothetical protein